jgi:predicted dehydrogenase
MMLELGCHLIDMIILILGEPKKVTPFLRHDGDLEDGLSDNTLAVLEYDRAMVNVETACMEPRAFGGRRFKIAGTQGAIVMTPLEPPKVRLNLRKAAHDWKPGTHEVEVPDLDRHVLDLQDLAKCIRGETEFAYSKDHDYAVQRTVLRACGETV